MSGYLPLGCSNPWQDLETSPRQHSPHTASSRSLPTQYNRVWSVFHDPRSSHRVLLIRSASRSDYATVFSSAPKVNTSPYHCTASLNVHASSGVGDRFATSRQSLLQTVSNESRRGSYVGDAMRNYRAPSWKRQVRTQLPPLSVLVEESHGP